MNQEIKNAFEYALLARAAYAKLDTNSAGRLSILLSLLIIKDVCLLG